MSAPQEYVPYAVLFALSTTACILRVAARIRTGSGFHADDYWVAAAYCFEVIHTSLSLKALSVLDITELETAHPDHLIPFLKLIYVGAMLCSVVISFAKFSIICLYKRIFGNNLKTQLIIVGSLQLVWLIVTVLVAIFRCRPISAAWNVYLHSTAKCVDLGMIVYVAEPLNAAIDLWLAALPIPAILRLNMSTQKKIWVSGIFAVGIFVAMTSVVRVVETSKANVNASGKWAAIQLNTAIICCCLPVLTGLLPKSGNRLLSLRNYLSSKMSGGRSSLESQNRRQPQMEFMGPKNSSTIIIAGSKDSDSGSDYIDEDHIENRIIARTDVSVVAYPRQNMV